MTIVFRWLFLPVMVVALAVVIRQHADYLRRLRPATFRAFLETAGWLIITLASGAAYGGGFESPGTRVVEVSAFVIGLLFVAVGSHTRQAAHPG
ncbi:MAG: hypothetical protein ACRDFA_10435 [bacterium]